IFLAVDRPDMGRISVEIRSPDPVLLLVRIDPLPHVFAGNASLRTCLALHAHEIGRKPVAIAAATAPTMVGTVARSVAAACERLPVALPKSLGDAGAEPSLVQRAKRMVKPQLEVLFLASNPVIQERHADFCAAFGSFHVKSSSTSLMMVLVTVRV